MFEYMTRHMVARAQMTYCGQDLQPGDPFLATPVDEEYLKKCKRAESAPPVKKTVVVAPPAPEAPAPVRRGRPPKNAVEAAVVDAPVAIVEVVEMPAVAPAEDAPSVAMGDVD